MSVYGLTSRDLINTITQENTGLNRGRISRLVERAVGRDGSRRAPESVNAYLRDLTATLSASAPPPPFSHPRDAARSRRLGSQKAPQNGSLSPSDIAWLSGLPADPEQVSFDDAVHLATLRNAVNSLDPHDGDRRLIEQRWTPVAEVYDRRSLDAELDAVSTLPLLPNPARAVADLLGAELTELNEAELFTRAESMVKDAFEQRQQRHQRRVETAQRRRGELDTAALWRRSTAR
ncbi:hypothetical protein [Rhodococcus sp. JG-3]|uniref:hypothetical protein n=1 Tax=Rhodococcus sp. JG-3 TaxID=1305835 RepID=UPI0003FA6831|nr:hypothetical protein [Rhodococcus sp. JG-3]